MLRLNLGCGPCYKKGYVNVDFYVKKADMHFDLNKYPYPFKNSSVDEIYMRSVLEHLDNISKFMAEAYRILKKNGRLIIEAFPHFTSAGVYDDPGHKHAASWKTFRYFVKGTPESYSNYYLGKVCFSKIKQRIIFGKKYAVWNYIVEPIANIFPHLYEDTPLRIFPALEIRIELIK